MKVAQLNCRMTGSPGMLMSIISDYLTEHGIDNRMYYTFGSSDKTNSYKYSSETEIKYNALLSRITGRYGFVSGLSTKRIIKELEDYKPDIIHIHVIHGHDLNFLRFFTDSFIKDIPVVYTIHDTWPFTGYCPNYDWVSCNKWKHECNTCPAFKTYSWFFDQSAKNFNEKKNALLSLKTLQIVTPSKWMKSQIEQSFLKDVSCTVIPNGIDTALFHRVQSGLKKDYGISDKHIALSLANAISIDKGLNDLIELSKLLPENYILLLVGVSEELKKELPEGILSFPRTSSKKELATFYSAADVFVNPTHGDNFPTVNLEALACGTPVVTYDVGGSPEAIDESSGIVVPFNDVHALADAVIKVANEKGSYRDSCRKRAVEQFDQEVFARRYYELYQRLI